MAETDPLFDLVKTLTTSEKKNLMRLARLQTGRKDYIRLLEKLDRMASFDENELKRMHLRNLSYTKNYLFQFILKALDHYDEASEEDIHFGIRNVGRLYERQMYDAALRLTDKLEEIAGSNEMFDEWLSVLELKLEILKGTHRAKGLSDQLELINKQLLEIEIKHRNLFDLKLLYYEFFLISRTKYIARGEIDVKMIGKLRDHPLMSTENNALSQRARLHFHKNAYVANLYLGNFDAARKSAENMVLIFDESPFLKKTSPTEYINLLSILAALHIQERNFPVAWDLLAKLSEFPQESVHTRVEHFDKYFTILIGYATDTGNLKVLAGSIPQIEAGLEKYKFMLPEARQILFHWILAKYFFVIRDYENAAKWAKSLLYFTKTDSRTDIQCVGRILNLIIVYERGDWELLEHYIKSTRRFLSVRKAMFRFEERFLKLMTVLTENPSAKSMIPVFRDFQNDLNAIFDDHFEKQILFYLDINAWISSKINSTTFLQETAKLNPAT